MVSNWKSCLNRAILKAVGEKVLGGPRRISRQNMEIFLRGGELKWWEVCRIFLFCHQPAPISHWIKEAIPMPTRWENNPANFQASCWRIHLLGNIIIICHNIIQQEKYDSTFIKVDSYFSWNKSSLDHCKNTLPGCCIFWAFASLFWELLYF